MDETTLPALAAGSYVHWGVIQISVANLIVIGAMLLIFIAALLVPFPGSGNRSRTGKVGFHSRSAISEGSRHDHG
jgi:hypothetical protein